MTEKFQSRRVVINPALQLEKERGRRVKGRLGTSWARGQHRLN